MTPLSFASIRSATARTLSSGVSRPDSARTLSPGRRDERFVQAIHARGSQLEHKSDAELQQLAEELKCLAGGGSLPERDLPQAFAVISEAVRRVTGKSYYDVQLLGGLSLARGEIAQMQTGEGKTLTTALPAFVFALAGRGVHIATTNAYLAQRDCEELRASLEFLNLTVGLLPEEHNPAQKQAAYACDVTFGTGYEFGFDFLRDQIALRQRPRLRLGTRHMERFAGRTEFQPQQMQREHAFAVIDEADSVLLDEATMPLILSGPGEAEGDQALYQLARDTAEQLQLNEHYQLTESTKHIELNDAGRVRLHELLRASRLRGLRRPWVIYVEGALRARHFLHRDVDYVIRDHTVQIVDQHTGRIHEERSWRDGLHQAVEVREGLPPSPEKKVDARISRQRYFQFYDHICGMTGTASGNEAEFREFYRLPVREIATHRPCVRRTLQPKVFANDAARDRAIAEEVCDCHRRGQPVLIGTRTIRHSQQLSRQLDERSLPHRVLNGMQDEDEAKIVAQAGRQSAVTIATNMAGRGTDIRPDARALTVGGLHVIVAEHHTSKRVDRQLAGRAARQGDPGSVRFYVCADDEFLAAAESHLPQRIRKSASENGEADLDIASEISDVQDRLERNNFYRRREMVQRDHWMEAILDTLARQV